MFRCMTVAPLFCISLAACSESTGPDAQIWGDYDYAASGFADAIVNDSAAIVPYFRQGSFTLTPDGGTFDLLAAEPSTLIGHDKVTGEVTAVEQRGTTLRFRFRNYYEHEGELNGRTISGTWSLECDPYGDDCGYGEGTFTARRR